MVGRWVGAALAVVALMACGADEPPRRESKQRTPLDWTHVYATQVGDVRVEFRNPPERKWDEVPHRVVAIAEDGSELWTIEHHGWWYPFREPVVVAGLLVYAIDADLLEVDVSEGRIVRRGRFPQRIVGLATVPDSAPGDSVLQVFVDGEALFSSGDVGDAAIRYRLGEIPPGRAGWGMLGHFRSESLATNLVADPPREMTVAVAGEALARIEGAEARDSTNPFFPYIRARLLQRLGREEEAQAAFHAAAALPGAVWSDLFHLSWWFELAGMRDEAELAFERGYARMLEARVRPERLQGLVAHNILFSNRARASIAAALDEGDAERVHVLETRRWRVFPKLEIAPEAWRVLEAWMREQGRDDLAEIWQQRALASEDGWLNRNESKQRAVQRTVLPLAFGLLIALPLLAFVVGVRVRSRKLTLTTHVHGLATFALPILVAFTLAALASGWFAMFSDGKFADDSFAAPSVVAALEQTPAGSERDEVLAYARAEAAAMAQGGWHDGPMPTEEVIAEAFTPMPNWSERFERANDVFVVESPWWRNDLLASIDHPVEYALVLLLPFALGLLLAHLLPRGARITVDLIPGGAKSFSIASGLVLGLFCAAVLAWLDYYGDGWQYAELRKLGGMSVPTTAEVFGFQDIWRDTGAGPSMAWAYISLVVIPLVQSLLVWRERTQDRGRST